MKSIKEKAKENCIKYGSLGDIAYSEFVDGANYVLDAIEEFQKLFSTCMNTHAKEYLKSIIEQLKK